MLSVGTDVCVWVDMVKSFDQIKESTLNFLVPLIFKRLIKHA